MSSARDPEDLTARARIRDAAMRQFAEHGFEKTTIRGIAKAAGVSSGLLRHHFGSKEELRAACDEYVLRIVREINDATWAAIHDDDLPRAAATRGPIGPYHRYVARSLIDGGASELFDEMVRMSEAWFTGFVQDDEPAVPLRDKAAVVTAWGLAIPILFEHLARTFGVDLTTPEGDFRLASALLDLYSNPLMSPEAAAKARSGLRSSAERGNPTLKGKTDE